SAFSEPHEVRLKLTTSALQNSSARVPSANSPLETPHRAQSARRGPRGARRRALLTADASAPERAPIRGHPRELILQPVLRTTRKRKTIRARRQSRQSPIRTPPPNRKIVEATP